MHTRHSTACVILVPGPLSMQFLTALAEGLLQQLLPGQTGELLHLRVGGVLREIVAAAVLRPVMMLCLPHNLNKVRPPTQLR